jgi:uncharacterized membrane protein YgcG
MSQKNLILQTVCCLFVFAVTFGSCTAIADAQSAGSLASPLPKAWIVDQTETLSDLQKKLINELCKEIQTDYNRQMVVAVTGSTHGKDHRRFAVELFNRWRVGGGYKNQGVLVFAAMDDRAAEIILGHGIDNRDTARAAQSIMDTVMVPKFKAGDAGSAIYEGVHACSKRIIGVGKLDVAPKLPEITAEQPVVMAEQPLDPDADIPDPVAASHSSTNADVGKPAGTNNDPTESVTENLGGADLSASQTDSVSGVLAESAGFRPLPLPARSVAKSPIPRASSKSNRPRMRNKPSVLPWVLGIGGVGLIGSFFGVRHYLRYRSRMCETCRIDRVLLTEVQDDDFLNEPQRIEEKIGSVDYDVWACLECEDVVKLRYGRWLTRYSKCPKCSYVTRFKITKTVVRATTMNGGLVRVKEFCKHCDYHHTYTYATPRIPKSSSGSSGGSVFSSGSSGRSSGGGFSSGGGASGRW